MGFRDLFYVLEKGEDIKVSGQRWFAFGIAKSRNHAAPTTIQIRAQEELWPIRNEDAEEMPLEPHMRVYLS